MDASYQKLEWKKLSEQFKPRDRAAYKGDFGHVLVIGGDHGMGGAVHLCAEAALRVGAGLVSVATRAEHVLPLCESRPEIMCHAVKNAAQLLPLIKKATVIVIGTGLGKSDWSRELFQTALNTEQNKVVDADALNLLSEKPQKKNNWILTPHVGEAARLLHCSTAQVQADRFDSAKKLCNQYGGIIVLKGAGTLIQAENELPFLCEAGNPGMASGGMGDVLSGVIGGLLAQHFSLLSAAKTGVLLHAMAGDLAAKENGERGLLASDLMLYLRQLVNG
ncbi:MAG TPA: NAD(P)H-hydrate dehydratase [Coxiellaceae bacterium]|nr:MAG: NAD(P)H-hydrate dehydratase [Gammaproteobacteria bacterium RIFCSPHIGHO2_12_FULL_36_30]HLB56455.1 NAD(P)H-hydrate dehydratase [Coxiellaceae bacterium]